MMPTLPTLPATLPVRPDAAPTPSPEAGAEAPRSESNGFARVLREAESGEARPPNAPEPATTREPREPRHPATRERTGPGRTRTGDTPETNGSARAAAKTPSRETAETPTTDAATSEPKLDVTMEGPAVTAPSTITTDAQNPLPDALALTLPALPPARVALDRVAPPENEPIALDASPDGPPVGRRYTGPVAGHTLPGRHPLAVVDGRSDGDSAATPANEARTRIVEAAAASAHSAAAAATKTATIEPVQFAASNHPMAELTAILPNTPGAVTVGVDGQVPRTVSGPAHAMAEARLVATPGTQAFTQSLGDQVGLWVRDGVQEARLQLHPAELGPVQISIALDGSSAQVDFHAAHARTREAIEASLPALASALRESGFTLAGGGVFGQGGGDASSRTPTRSLREPDRRTAGTEAVEAATGDAMAATAARSRGWRRGLLDVFA